jgi:hypothetical protein
MPGLSYDRFADQTREHRAGPAVGFKVPPLTCARTPAWRWCIRARYATSTATGRRADPRRVGTFDEVVAEARRRYIHRYERITGQQWS